MPARIPLKRAGDTIRAADWNLMAQALNTLLSFSVSGDLQMSAGPMGFKALAMGGVKLRLVILDADLTYNKTASENKAAASVWASYPEEDSTANIDVYPWMLADQESISQGTEGVAALINGKWYLIDWACEVSARTEGAEGMAGGGDVSPTASGDGTATTAAATSQSTATVSGEGGYSNPSAR